MPKKPKDDTYTRPTHREVKGNNDDYTRTQYGRVIRKPDSLTYSLNITYCMTGQLAINQQGQLNHHKNYSQHMIPGHLADSVS